MVRVLIWYFDRFFSRDYALTDEPPPRWLGDAVCYNILDQAWKTGLYIRLNFGVLETVSHV